MGETDIAQAQSHQKAKRASLFGVGLLFLVAGTVFGVWLYNQQVLQKPLERVLLEDPRNHVIRASARFDGWVDLKTISFEIVAAGQEAAPLDGFRVFLQYAKEMQENRYNRVILSSHGVKKFIISGEYFQTLGREFSDQNPVYTIRTFAHHVTTLDGQAPFPEPHGGLLFVLGEEMKQFGEFSKRWWVDDALRTMH